MPNPTVINIASGKGGTGKTLLSAVLADMLGNIGVPVLVIDLDIYVRGLTALLYFHRQESLNLITSDQLSVANLFINKIKKEQDSKNKELGISRYRSFDILPAVGRIDENLNFNDILPNSKEEAAEILKNLMQMVPDKYELIFLDSRAGYDELIAATHAISDATVCVEEGDSISKITADNLVSQLGHDSNIPILRLINKARQIHHVSEIDDEPRSITDLGPIPFDLDVMNSFGDKDFWDGISRSLYRSGLTKAWNRLATRLNLKNELPEMRISPLASSRLEEKLGLFSMRDRVLLLYGITLGAFGLGYAFMNPETISYLIKEPFRLASLIMGGIGILISLYVLLRLGQKPK